MKSFFNCLKQIFFFLKNPRAISFKKLNPVIINKILFKILKLILLEIIFKYFLL